MRAAFFAEADLSAGLRFRAAWCACRDNAVRDAAAAPSFLSAPSTARERLAEGLLPDLPLARSRFACSRTFSGCLPFSGGGSFTPARLALDSPMAMICFADRAPCSPSRTRRISSRTNSPACADADLSSFLRVRSIFFLEGFDSYEEIAASQTIGCPVHRNTISSFCSGTYERLSQFSLDA